MDTLHGTSWDVVIAGTGLQQSLLALALSRSDKKVLHVDKNDFYGGPVAAFSLQEAERWAKSPAKDQTTRFRNIEIRRPPAETDNNAAKLSFSRAYSLCLAPQFIYCRSGLIPLLVSSKVYKQLEFLAVGSWWVYKPADATSTWTSGERGTAAPSLLRVPSSQEDVFATEGLDIMARRKLMKFLRFITNLDNQRDMWQSFESMPFTEFLESKFGLPAPLQQPLLALTMSHQPASKTETRSALQAIGRHLSSIGVFGRGFSAVIPKWGGLSEIAQVGCRAGAVGGAVYVLGKGVAADGVSALPEEPDGLSRFKIQLEGGEWVTTNWVVGGEEDLTPLDFPLSTPEKENDAHERFPLSCSVSIVSSTLESLFPLISDGSPPPAASVVFFPSGSLQLPLEGPTAEPHPPVYIHVHSSDTGVLYASVLAKPSERRVLLQAAVRSLLETFQQEEHPCVLWQMHFEQCTPSYPHSLAVSTDHPQRPHERVLRFPSPEIGVAFDDEILAGVKAFWAKIMGNGCDEDSFMIFEDRETMAAGEDEESV